MILGLVDEAVAAGARQSEACRVLGIDSRTLQRWRGQGIGDDGRAGPLSCPGNKLSKPERERILKVVNGPEYRDLSPKQIVPKLADTGTYLASESTMYRILREADQQTNRERSRPPHKRHRPEEFVAMGSNQVWSWDISYLRSPTRGLFFYLYLVVDVWSRKVVGWAVHEEECSRLASELMTRACAEEGIHRNQLVIHADNGSPMKGATLLSTLQGLGVVTSFSRPSVSNDNPYSEALFRTVKYRPEYPSGAFASIEEARAWVARFVHWYNTEHQHSAIRFVTPDERHSGRDVEILAARKAVYETARARHPERWSGRTRDWSRVEEVRLNPEPEHAVAEAEAA